jgi:hypothetical protein
MVEETERLKGIIEIETFLHELDQLLLKLTEIETAIQAVDGQTVRVDAETRGFESALAQVGALRGVSSGDISFGGGGRGTSIAAPDIDTDIGQSIGEVTQGVTRASRTVGSFGDSVSEVTESVDEVAEATGGFLTNLSEADIRMTDLHNALAKAVPLILVVIGALPALIAGLVGVAAAAAAATAALLGIAGFAALGFAMAEGETITEGFQEILSDIRGSFLDAFTPLAEQLAPLFEDALDGLERFFQALADNGDALLMFEQTARDFGAFIIDEFPDFIAFLADVARAFGPVFEAIAEALFDSNVGEGFMQFMADVLPALMRFGALVASILPDLLRMSIGFLEVTNALLTLVSAFFSLLDLLGVGDQLFGVIIAGTLAAATAMLLYNSTLVGAISRLGAFVLGLVKTASAEGVYTAATNLATTATAILTSAVVTLIGVLTLGIGALVAVGVTTSVVSSQFNDLTGNVNQASRSIRNFDRVSSRMSGPRADAFAPSTTPARAGSGSGGGQVNVTVEGDADRDTVETQTRNATHRMNRTKNTNSSSL